MKKLVLRHSSKIVFFLLVGFVATLGYIAGGLDNSVAQQDVGYFNKLYVTESVMVGEPRVDQPSNVIITATEESASIMLNYKYQEGSSLPGKSYVMIMASEENDTKRPMSVILLSDEDGNFSNLRAIDNLSIRYVDQPKN